MSQVLSYCVQNVRSKGKILKRVKRYRENFKGGFKINTAKIERIYLTALVEHEGVF
jgi:hypothetical protein